MARYAYVTLVTRASYLAGVVILADSLRRQQSPYPLIVCFVETLPLDCQRALHLESTHSNLLLRVVAPLQPSNFTSDDLIAERFADTWTKLRVFEPWQPPNHPGFDRLCYLDADMMLRRPMDIVFDINLPSADWLAASHACVCNVDKDSWAPKTWEAANCPYVSSENSCTPPPVATSTDAKSQLSPAQRETYAYFNSGMFLFQPTQRLWGSLHHVFNSLTPETLKIYKLPDQDFLNNFFRDRWVSVGWQLNALKTMRYLHPRMWQDDTAINVHYIVDKPWAGPRPLWSVDDSNPNQKCTGYWSKAGFKGHDGVTHSWWWASWDDWTVRRKMTGCATVVDLVRKHVYEEGSVSALDLQAIGALVQSFANRENKTNGAMGIVTECRE